MRRFLLRHLTSYLAVLALLAAGAGVLVARGTLARALQAIPVTTVALALLLSLCNYCLRFAKWQLFLRTLQAPVPPLESARIYFACLCMVVTPARLGELTKLALLRDRHGIAMRRTAAVLLVERLTDALALVLLTGLGVWAGRSAAWGPIVLVVTGIATTAILGSPRFRHVLLGWLGRLAPLRRRAAAVEEILANNARLLAPPVFLPAMLLSLTAWFAECVALERILAGLGTPLPWPAATWSYAFATIAGNATLIPGGLGGTEAGLFALLRDAGIARDPALAATLLVRAATLWFAVALGVAVTLLSRRSLRLGELEGEALDPAR